MTMATIDDQGRCLSHPFVQLQRLSPRTGEWKALLDSCPLCAIDNKSTSGDNSSVCDDSSYCSSAIVGYEEAEESNPLVVTPTLVRKGGGSNGRDSRSRSSRSLVSRRDRERSPPQRRRSTSRVRFGETTQATAASPTAEDGNPYIVPSPASPLAPSASGFGASQSLSGLSNMNIMEHNLTGHDNSSASVSSQCSQLTKSVLKALPKYKSCKKKMQAQLDLSEKQRITTMSMDLSLEFSMDDESSSEEEEEDEMNDKLEEIEREAGLVDINEKKIEELEKRLSEIEREAGLVEDEMGKVEDLLPPNKKVETRLREDESESRSTRKKDSGSSSRRHRSRGSSLSKSKTKSNSFHGSSSSRGSSLSKSKTKSNSFHDSSGSSRTPSSSKQRSSSVQIQRPDPEEFPCNASVCQSQPLESQDNRQQKRQSHPSQPQPQQHQVSRQGRATMSLTQQRTKDQLCQPPPPPFQTSMVHSMQLQASPKTSKINSMQLQASPSPGSNSSRHNVQQPIHTNMVVSPAPNYDDEISTLSYMGNSVQSAPSVTLRRHQYEDPACTDSNNDQDATNTANSTPPSVPRIKTNDYDAKGRCIHHPHIRLRKKKLFGRGWKIQMSACPDCCVDELRRIRMVDQNKNRMMEKKERKRSKSGNVDGSERSTGTGDRSTSSRGSRGSGHNGSSLLRNSIRSIGSHPQSPQPQLSASIRSTGSQQQSPLTHIPRSSSSSHNSMSTPKMVGASSSGNYSIPNPSGTSLSKPHPPPPPRHSVESTNAMRHTSQNQRSSASLQRRSPSQESSMNSSSKMMLMTAKKNANKKNDTLQRPSDGTASLTGSSSGSSNEMLDNSNRTNISNIQASSNTNNIQLPTRRPSVDLVPTRKSSSGSTRSSRSKSKGKSNNSSHQDVVQQQQQQQQGQILQQHQQGTIHVRQMQWIDPKNQKSGTYTGQVTAQFVPHGHGTMEYDDSTTGTASREGEWKNGRFRSKGGGVSKSGKSSSGSNSRVARSKSRDVGEGEARSRSRSVARQHRSASKLRVQPQQQQEVAV